MNGWNFFLFLTFLFGHMGYYIYLPYMASYLPWAIGQLLLLNPTLDETEENVLTYKVDIYVVDWGFLQANVDGEEDRMHQIAAETDI